MQCTVIAVLITAARGQQAESVENVFHVHTSDHVYRASEGNKKNTNLAVTWEFPWGL